MRRLLLAANPAEYFPPQVTPGDPTLTTPRAITQSYAINQNIVGTGVSGTTWDYPTAVRLMEDSRDLRLHFHGGSQGVISNPTHLQVSIKKPGSSVFVPVLFGGAETAEMSDDQSIVSDVIDGTFLEGTELYLRIHVAANETVNRSFPGRIKSGDHRTADPFTPDSEFLAEGPWPLMIEGKARSEVISLGVFGDSISASASWWRDSLAEHDVTGVNFGRNVMTFNGRWLSAELVTPLTHMLVQFGVNDLGPGPSVETLWTSAKACYAYIDGLKPGIPIYQTTPTPTVDDLNFDGCATLEGQGLQVPRSAARLDWLAWQRDGMPFNSSTGASVAVGAPGVRIGQVGHPVTGLVDIAADVEYGGVGTPSGKWRIDQGPLGGDGVHPFNNHPLMSLAVSAWVSALLNE